MPLILYNSLEDIFYTIGRYGLIIEEEHSLGGVSGEGSSPSNLIFPWRCAGFKRDVLESKACV